MSPRVAQAVRIKTDRDRAPIRSETDAHNEQKGGEQ